MEKYAELQIGLHKWGANEFEVELVYSDSSEPGDQRLTGDAPRLAALDPAEFLSLTLRPKEYGQALAQSLFADPEVRAFFDRSCEAAARLADPHDPHDEPGCPLQIRLHIGRRVTALHDLRWETLCDPRDGTFLATKETVVFSRYLSSPNYRPLRSRSPGDKLQLVVAVADPENAEAVTVGARQRRLTRCALDTDLPVRAGGRLRDLPAHPGVASGGPWGDDEPGHSCSLLLRDALSLEGEAHGGRARGSILVSGEVPGTDVHQCGPSVHSAARWLLRRGDLQCRRGTCRCS